MQQRKVNWSPSIQNGEPAWQSPTLGDIVSFNMTLYMVVQADPGRWCLIDLRTGNRLIEPVPVEYLYRENPLTISKSDWDCVTGDRDFKEYKGTVTIECA